MKIITRDNYFSELISLRGTPDVKIITGRRGRIAKPLLFAEILF